MRRALIIGASIIVLFGAALAAYYYFFANTASLSVAPSTSLPSAETATNIVDGASSDGSLTTINTGADSAMLAVTKVTARLVKISAGPVVPGEAVVDITKTSLATST